MGKKLRIEMTVEVRDTLIDDDGVWCRLTGDSYDSIEEFAWHQLNRDLQVLIPVANEVEVYEVTDFGPLHYCAATPSCPGGRNDTGDWSAVDCPACLKSRPE